MSPGQRIGEARVLLRYFVDSDPVIRAINSEHHANPRAHAERQILAAVIEQIARSHTREVQEINRGWEGETDPATHRIFMQRWPRDDPLDAQHIAQRTALWDTCQIFVHESLHALTHDRYDAFATSLGGERENTLSEGMTSVMTETAWANAHPSDANLRRLVEGATFAALPFDARTVPDIANRRYSSYDQAIRVVETVGIQNVYGAYFLGHVDLIRPAAR